MIDEASRPERLNNSELATLMCRYQQSDAQAATLLAEHLSPRLYQYFIAQTSQREEAWDLVQDCWLRIHKARHTYRPSEPLLPWIYAIAHRTRVDQYRNRRRMRLVELPADPVDNAVQQADKTSSLDIWKLLDVLPRRQRETVLLLKVAGLSLQEVSRATGVTVGAVKQRAHRAYTTLRRLIGEKQ